MLGGEPSKNRDNRMKKILLGSAVVALLAPTLGAAAPPASVRAACAQDARRLCSAVFGDPQARQACMREHRAELSSECRAAIAEFRRGQGAGPGVVQRRGAGKENLANRGDCAVHWRGGECKSSAWLRRRERCADQVQQAYLPQHTGGGASWRRAGGTAVNALQRCMRGGAM
jgi:hypothetical protein